jgi:hypothetical protein
MPEGKVLSIPEHIAVSCGVLKTARLVKSGPGIPDAHRIAQVASPASGDG